MSPKQKILNAKDLIELAKKAGFILSRQRGSHMIFYHSRGIRLTIPNHGRKNIHPKIIKSILRDIDSVSKI
jgi:predicted RNA binding protein YcfA (HicA-like mRNA interferase family)